MTDKDVAFDALKGMPEQITLAEIAEELAVMAAIKQGQEDIAAGRSITLDELKKKVASWISE